MNARHFAEGEASAGIAAIACQWFTNGAGNATSAQHERAIGNPADYRMLRIEKETDGCVSKLKLSGRIQSGCITRIRAVLNDGCARKILDLREITLVDIEVVRFLIRCENEGIELLECPLYVREWMLRERAEGAQPQNP